LGKLHSTAEGGPFVGESYHNILAASADPDGRVRVKEF
jgi:hypothetical protein